MIVSPDSIIGKFLQELNLIHCDFCDKDYCDGFCVDKDWTEYHKQ